MHRWDNNIKMNLNETDSAVGESKLNSHGSG
jgi:hypothetical protein